MARTYTLPTIKTLFAQASKCAFPRCTEPLVFQDRSARTVTAEIAHIRSEKPNGPRHDPTYKGDINGVDNLLLLCGKHHAPVDRHEDLYAVDELLVWKLAQVSGAGAGTTISDQDARSFIGLTNEERAAVAQVARLSARVENACDRARDLLGEVELARLRVIQEMRTAHSPIWAVHDDGTKTLMTDSLQLSVMEERKWQERFAEVRTAAVPGVEAAIDALSEEVAVLRMMSDDIGYYATVVLATAQGAAQHFVAEEPLRQSIEAMRAALRTMWLVVGGRPPPPR